MIKTMIKYGHRRCFICLILCFFTAIFVMQKVSVSDHKKDVGKHAMHLTSNTASVVLDTAYPALQMAINPTAGLKERLAAIDKLAELDQDRANVYYEIILVHASAVQQYSNESAWFLEQEQSIQRDADRSGYAEASRYVAHHLLGKVEITSESMATAVALWLNDSSVLTTNKFMNHDLGRKIRTHEQLSPLRDLSRNLLKNRFGVDHGYNYYAWIEEIY